MGPSWPGQEADDSRVDDAGWIRLRRGGIKRSGARVSCASFALTATVVIVGFFVLASLDIFPLVGFLLLSGLMVVVTLAIGKVLDLMWGPRVSVSVSRQPTRPGEMFRVRHSIGHPERVNDVSVTWEGREVAIFRAYDDSTFVEAFLVQKLEAFAGSHLVDVPADAMPSFRGKNVRIEWCVSVETLRGETRTREDFPVLVLPGR